MSDIEVIIRQCIERLAYRGELAGVSKDAIREAMQETIGDEQLRQKILGNFQEGDRRLQAAMREIFASQEGPRFPQCKSVVMLSAPVTIGFANFPQTDSIWDQYSTSLGELRWMLDRACGNILNICGQFAHCSPEDLVDYALRSEPLNVDLTSLRLLEPPATDAALLALYPSGAVRTLAGEIRTESGQTKLRLDDPLGLLDPDGPQEEIPEGGLAFMLNVLPIQEFPG